MGLTRQSAAVPSQVEDVLHVMQGLFGRPADRLALHEPKFGPSELEYVRQCVESGWVSSVGSFVDRFERDLERFTGAAAAVATSNGTSALHVCLLLVGVRPGDEVLVPTLTFVATANAVSYASAVPHFVDSEPTSLGVDPVALRRHLENVAEVRNGECFNVGTNRRIRALVVMHAFGHPADLPALQAVAAEWKLELVEDAAESLGSYFEGVHTGLFGRVAALSFNGNKIVTTGGGGAIISRDVELAARAKHLTTTARVPDRWGFVHDQVGFNYRLPNLNAALGCAQMEKLGVLLRQKRELAQHYRTAFASLDGVSFLAEPTGTTSNYWLNTFLIDESGSDARDVFLEVLNNGGFMARPVWRLMHKLPMYAACPRSILSQAESLERRIINLPSSAHLVEQIRSEA